MTEEISISSYNISQNVEQLSIVGSSVSCSNISVVSDNTVTSQCTFGDVATETSVQLYSNETLIDTLYFYVYDDNSESINH